MKKIGSKIASWFAQGLLLLVPVSVSLYIIYFAFTKLDQLIPFGFPGMGILIVLSSITILGALASSFLIKPLLRKIEFFFSKTPLLKFIYSAIKDILNALVGDARKFDKPVQVRFDDHGTIIRLGFLTSHNLQPLGLPQGKVAVYLPHSYNFSGNLVIVDENRITPIAVNTADFMKFIVTAGAVTVPQSQNDTL
jgi:uncharacterized membrane protein